MTATQTNLAATSSTNSTSSTSSTKGLAITMLPVCKILKGPWDDEPMAIEWRDTATGLKCLVLKSDLGHLCGYVRIMRGHKLYRRDYTKIRATVHGGLIFGRTVKHLRYMKRGYWVGFDCGHSGDLVPKLLELSRESLCGNIYRNGAYVRQEVTSLARQLWSMR